MAHQVLISDLAKVDLQEITEYIAQDNPAAAARFAQKLLEGDRRGQTLFVLTEMVCKKTSFQYIESMEVHDVPSGFSVLVLTNRSLGCESIFKPKI